MNPTIGNPSREIAHSGLGQPVGSGPFWSPWLGVDRRWDGERDIPPGWGKPFPAPCESPVLEAASPVEQHAVSGLELVGLSTAGRRPGLSAARRSRNQESDTFPLHERVGRLRVVVILVDRRDPRSDQHVLLRVADQVSDHPDPPGIGEFDDHDDVGAGLRERRMDGMPDPLPAEEDRRTGNRFEVELEAVTAMADPFCRLLPAATVPAALCCEFVSPSRFPERGVETVGRRHRLRDAIGQDRNLLAHRFARRFAHSVASEPTITFDAGVTIGPEFTNETSTSGTGLGDVPRTCRTASIFSSRPCM